MTKVLIVDDEADFSQALADRMELRGLKVETAGSGKDALKKVEDSNYDAVILDLVMPEMDGIETLKKVLAKKPNLQIIFLTGHASVGSGVESMKLGALDFMEKPADIDALLKRIEEAKANRLVLVEKDSEASIREILTKKGW